jgi:hypothetical protein
MSPGLCKGSAGCSRRAAIALLRVRASGILGDAIVRGTSHQFQRAVNVPSLSRSVESILASHQAARQK